jgi:hypothetical protein
MRRMLPFVLLLMAWSASAADLDKAKWLSGCWAGVDGERSFEERWMAPKGGAMVGVGRTFKGEAMSSAELTIIRTRDGGLAYNAFPVGQPPAVFPSIVIEDDALTFENLEHDFPQRILYRKTADGMVASIEGMMKGKLRRIDYPMKRVPCE